MKRFISVSIGIFVVSLSLIDRVNAQSSTTSIDTTPKHPSLCIFSKDTKGLAYGKAYEVIAQNGEKAIVVADINYTNTFGDFAMSLLTNQRSKHPEYFSLWSWNAVFFQTENLPHSMNVLEIHIDGQRFTLESFNSNTTYSNPCKYGNQFVSWSRDNTPYKLSEEIQEALRNYSGKSNVKIVYGAQYGNKFYKTEFPIGDGTIQTWRKIDKFYRRMAEKNKPVETQTEESSESDDIQN